VNGPTILRNWDDRGVLVVAAEGVLNLRLSASLWRTVVKCLAEEPAAVVVDLSDLRLERTSVATFSALARVAAERPGTSFGVCGASPEATRLFETMGVARTVPSWATVAEAVEHVRDPPSRRRIKKRIASSPQAPALGRRLVMQACRGWSVHPEVTAAASMVTSELVTNAVVHAGGDLQVTVELAGAVLIVSVRDKSPTPPRPGRPVAGQEHGRGLAIVAELSRSWGTVQTADGGKVVWARLPAQGPPASPPRLPRARDGGRR